MKTTGSLKFRLHCWAMKHIRVYKALQVLKRLEGFSKTHGEGRFGFQEGLIEVHSRVHYKTGRDDGERHVGWHAYFWSGGQDEDFKYTPAALHDHLEQAAKLIDAAQALAQSILTKCDKRTFDDAKAYLVEHGKFSGTDRTPDSAE